MAVLSPHADKNNTDTVMMIKRQYIVAPQSLYAQHVTLRALVQALHRSLSSRTSSLWVLVLIGACRLSLCYVEMNKQIAYTYIMNDN